MSNRSEAEVYLVRHGETAWTLTGQHTGRTDLPLTAGGEDQARSLAPRLAALRFDQVLSSPLIRAQRTCELAGFGRAATFDPDLMEWDYGRYEGKTLAEIRRERPDWELFRDGCPGGESVTQIADRVDRLLSRIREFKGRTLLFSSGHLSRVLAARWIDAPAALGRNLMLDPAAVSLLGYDHHGSDRVIRLWNDHQIPQGG